MEKKFFSKRIMGKVILICLTCLICVQTSMAQGSVSDKIEQAKRLFSVQLSTSTNEQINSAISFFDHCTNAQKDTILSYMVQTITDSLKADKKQFAMNYIDYYRLIADPDNEYLGSLVVTEAKYYHDSMDASRLSELSEYLDGLASRSKLDYSTEMAELNTMKDNLLHGLDKLLGYWVVDDDYRSEPLFYMKIEKVNGQIIVSLSIPLFLFNIYNKARNPDYMKRHEQLSHDLENKIIKANDFSKQVQILNEEFGIEYKEYFIFKGDLSSLECIQTNHNSLSFFWASQKIKKGNDYLATGLRSGVRTISNDIIGELAKSNTYSFGTSVTGTLGAIFGEVVINALIDGVSTSKNTIRTISGALTLTGKNSMDADLYVDYFHATTDDSNVVVDSCECKVKLMRYDLSDPYISENIVFYDFSGFKSKLRQYKYLSSKEAKQFIRRHPEAKKHGNIFKTTYWEGIEKFNKEQYKILKEYNATH